MVGSVTITCSFLASAVWSCMSLTGDTDAFPCCEEAAPAICPAEARCGPVPATPRALKHSSISLSSEIASMSPAVHLSAAQSHCQVRDYLHMHKSKCTEQQQKPETHRCSLGGLPLLVSLSNCRRVGVLLCGTWAVTLLPPGEFFFIPSLSSVCSFLQQVA